MRTLAVFHASHSFIGRTLPGLNIARSLLVGSPSYSRYSAMSNWWTCVSIKSSGGATAESTILHFAESQPIVAPCCNADLAPFEDEDQVTDIRLVTDEREVRLVCG